MTTTETVREFFPITIALKFLEERGRKISFATLYRWCRHGDVKHRRRAGVIEIPRKELERLLKPE